MGQGKEEDLSGDKHMELKNSSNLGCLSFQESQRRARDKNYLKVILYERK